jgi:hypothetical protein
MSYQTTEPNVRITAGPWRWSPQIGEAGNCRHEALVWNADGNSVAVLEPKPDPVEGGDNARFIAAAGTAAAKLPEGADPMTVMRLLPEIYGMADWVVGSADLEGDDPNPPDRELLFHLREVLNETRADWLEDETD